MVNVITVEREYGSHGVEFARRLAERLEWKLVDRCLVDEIARLAGVPAAMAEECDERIDPWYYRVGKSFWHGAAEQVPAPPGEKVFDSERMASLVRDYLKSVAAEGRCVIVGRGGACALMRVPHVFNIFVYASTARKTQWFEQQFPGEAPRAAQAIEANDRRRAEYIRRHFDMDWNDRRLYHLMMNSCMGTDAMVNATLDAAGLAAGFEAQTAAR